MPHASWNLQKSKLVLSFCQEAATSCLILHPTSVTEVIYVVPFCMNLPESTNLILPTAQTNCQQFPISKQPQVMYTWQGEAEAPWGRETAANRPAEQCSWPAPHSSLLRTSATASSLGRQPRCPVFTESPVQPFLLGQTRSISSAYNSMSRPQVNFAYPDLKAISSSTAGLATPRPVTVSP